MPRRKLAPVRVERDMAAVALGFDSVRIDLYDEHGERVSVIRNISEVERAIQTMRLAITDSARMDT